MKWRVVQRTFAALCLASCLCASARAQAPEGGEALGPAELETRGFDLMFGRDVERDPAEAFRLLERAAEQGRAGAQLVVATQLYFGSGVDRDVERARRLYSASAQQGVASAQAFLGCWPGDGGRPPRDPVEALRWLRPAAAQEDSFALYCLSQMYLLGEGVDRDLDFYAQLNMRAAELGHPRARVETGLRWLYGQTRHDVALGMHFLERGANAQDPVAQYYLGREYLFGGNVKRDFAAAAHWLGQAAERKHPSASLWLAELHAKGLGVERDDERAASLRASAFAVATPFDKNAFSWEASTNSDAELRDGALAVQIMEELLGDAQMRSPAFLDTLAAAYAETGEFDRAIDAQTQARAALPQSAPQATIADFVSRLELYRRREPYRVSR